jgi:hypothetical protein
MTPLGLHVTVPPLPPAALVAVEPPLPPLALVVVVTDRLVAPPPPPVPSNTTSLEQANAKTAKPIKPIRISMRPFA